MSGSAYPGCCSIQSEPKCCWLGNQLILHQEHLDLPQEWSKWANKVLDGIIRGLHSHRSSQGWKNDARGVAGKDMDCLPVTASSKDNLCQLLGDPVLPSGTGAGAAEVYAVHQHLFKQWIQDWLVSMVFDKTVSNIRSQGGACTLLE